MLNHLIAQLDKWANLFIPYTVNKCKEAMYQKKTIEIYNYRASRKHTIIFF